MTRQEHLLTILAEECMEVAQRATKALRFGLEEVQPEQEASNSERILYEYADLLALMEMIFGEDCSQTNFGIMRMVWNKKAKVALFLKYSKEQGTLQE